jgi:hypothetical protein
VLGVVRVEERFFVVVVCPVDFLAVGLTVLLVDLETVLLAVFAGVLADERADVLLDGVAALRVDAPVDAIASIRGAGFFFTGVTARTCRMALVCCSSVIRNSWWPSGLATKYRYGTLAGFAAAARLATPGDATGPGGRPLCV